MSETSEFLLVDARKALAREAAVVGGRGDLEEAFVAWLLPDLLPGRLEALSRRMAGVVGGERTYQHVAALGFAASIGKSDHEVQSAFQAGLNWLLQRPAYVQGTPVGFSIDATALLGITLGSKSIEVGLKDRLSEWLSGFIDDAYQARLTPDWRRCLFAAVKRLASLSPDLPVPDGPDCSDVRVLLQSRGLLPEAAPIVAEQETRQVLLATKADCGSLGEPIRAALRLAAFDHLVQSSPTLSVRHISLEEVGDLLRRVPAGLRRWTWEDKPRTRGAEPRKWHVENEYHVQSLLYLLLAPIFRDLKEEEYTPSVGQLKPRADLAIPSLKLVIEVKFMRSTMTFQDLTEQIVTDAGLYLQRESLYEHVVAFVWDDSRRTEEYPLLVSGLKNVNGIYDIIIIPRPGNMAANTG